MSFFASTFGKANAASAIKPLTNNIRKETRPVPAKPSINSPQQPPKRPAITKSASATNGIRKTTSRTESPRPHKNKAAGSTTPRTVSASSSSPSSASKLKSRPTAIRKDNKRKSESPAYGATFGSASEGENEVDFDSYTSSRKRTKLGTPSTSSRTKFPMNSASNGPKREIRDKKNWSEEGGSAFDLVHSASLTSGTHTTEYTPAFTAAVAGSIEASTNATTTPPDSVTTFQSTSASPLTEEVQLQYPNASQPERFQLVQPKAADGYRPLDDIYKTIVTTLTHYFPEETTRPLLHNVSGIPPRLERALRISSLSAFLSAVEEYNTLIGKSRKDGTIAAHLDANLPTPYLEQDIVERILEQIYERTVSPQVDLLRKYAMGSDNVYGEIKPRFASQIFRDTHLTPSSVFVDLGSGVGNVVLQAALEVGCEAYGLEIMSNPSTLAAAQAAEFPSRCRAWGVAPGSVSLRQGDFLDDSETAAVLRRADVILVNNKAFTAETDTRLTHLFLDLKEGARIVSLKSFVRSDFKLSERTSGSLVSMLDVEKREFWTDYVSWTHEGGEYFIAVKDSSRLAHI